MALINTGSVNTDSTDDINMDHANGGMRVSLRGFVWLIIVLIKFVALSREDAHAKYIAFIIKFTDFPAWCVLFDRGGYRVQPVAAPYCVGVPFVRSDNMV